MPPSSVVSHCSFVELAEPDRVVLGLARRGRSAERRRDLARLDRLSVARQPSANENVASPSDDPEPAQHLRGEEVLGQQPAKPDSLSCGTSGRTSSTTSSIGRPVDRRDAAPRQHLGADRADDVEAVGEVVEPQRVDVERSGDAASKGKIAVCPSRGPGSAARRISPTTSSSRLSSGAVVGELGACARSVARGTSWKSSGWVDSIVSASARSSCWSGVGGGGLVVTGAAGHEQEQHGDDERAHVRSRRMPSRHVKFDRS